MTEYPHYAKEELTLFDNLPSAVLINIFNEEGRLEYAYSNPVLAESLGYTHEEFKALLTSNCFAAIYEADRDKARNARSKVAAGQIVDSISRQVKKDGSFVWILAHIRQIDLDGQKGMLFLFSRIQELIGLQNKLTAQNKEWKDIMQSVPIGLLVYRVENNIRTVISVNQSMIDLANSLGSQLDSKERSWTEAELSMILNQDIYAFCENEDIPTVSKMLKDSEHLPITECIFKLRGSYRVAASPVYIYATCASKESENNSRTYYVTYQNVTDTENQKLELIEKQTQLYEMSYNDALTGVKNRNAYNKYAEYCRHNRIRNVGFAFCDINGLKMTNDTYGHSYGDKLIRHFADILMSYFNRENIYRISGDEFVIICPDVENDHFQAQADSLISRVKKDNCLASIGYIWKESVSDIPRRATQAEKIMYLEKQKYYETSRTITSKHRPKILEELLNEFDNGHFVMYLQPKISIDDSRIIGVEALARKIDAKGNIALPYTFVPQLEHDLLIPKLDFFMLEEVCKFLRDQHLAGNDDFTASVNISNVTLVENEFLQTVSSILDKYDFDRKNLEIEINESNKTVDHSRIEKYISRLKEMNIKISLDDIGNDSSSLRFLAIDGFDWVKLDRSVISRLDQEKTSILVKHLISTCHELGLKVIAEGVETEDIRALLMKMGCDAYQGYLRSKPVPAENFKAVYL